MIPNMLLNSSEVTQQDLEEVLSPDDMMALQSEVTSVAIQHQDLVNASTAIGGPGSLNEAISQGMIFCGLTVEKLSKKINVSKYRLTKMLSGEMDMSPKTLGKIMALFHKLKPNLYPAA